MAKQKLDVISLKIPHDLVLAIDKMAQKQDRSRSSVIRVLLTDYLETYEDLKEATRIKKAYDRNPDSLLSHDEVLSKLGISKDELES